MQKILDKNTVAALLPKRKRNTNKGDYTGAAYLAAAACLRAGAGYTALFVPQNIFPYFVLKIPEVLLKKFTNLEELKAYDSIAYGMGMGVSRQVADGAVWLIENFSGRLILDADALNSLAKYCSLEGVFARKKGDVLLTPHVKEFSRLCKQSVEEILANGFMAAKEFAARYKVNVLLKNAVSVIENGENTYINKRGTSGQAKGGSGDVLSGVIAGLCASGRTTFDGACAGAYIVGLAAELAGENISEYSLTATDLISYLGGAFLHVTKDTNGDCNGD